MIRILFFLLLPCTLFSQQKLKIELVYGVYTDDHAERKFDAKERIWKVAGQQMTYSIDAHNKRYADTLTLTEHEIRKIVDYITLKQLDTSVDTQLSTGFLEKYEYNEVIKGRISIHEKETNYNIRADSPSLLSKDLNINNLQGLEQVFYQLIENHR